MGALRDPLVTYPMVSFRWPGLVHLTANRWRVDVVFRHGASQRIPVVWTTCHFGGWRPWLMCGRCGRRVGKLYSTGVALHCRRCLALWYGSQRRGSKSRRYLRALKLRLRLNGIANLREPFPPRPKRMHRKTYARLRHLGERLEEDLRDNPRFRDRGNRLWVPAPSQQQNKGHFCPLCLRLHTLYQRDQTLTEFAPHPNLS
jgi:hypothetical protein